MNALPHSNSLHLSVWFSFTSSYSVLLSVVFPLAWTVACPVASRAPTAVLCVPADRVISDLVPVIVCDYQLPALIGAVPGLGKAHRKDSCLMWNWKQPIL